MVKFINVSPAGREVCDGAASFLQSGLWGNFKARFGWEPRAFLADWKGGGRIPLLVLERPLLPGLSFAYVPRGPELPPGFPAAGRGEALAELAAALKPLLPRRAAFIRFDPPWYAGEGETGEAALYEIGRPFVRAAVDVQPPDTVIIDLAKDEEALLADMKPKGRYNVRLAERKGVLVRRLDEKGLDRFYALFGETARRDGIAVHSAGYYRALFETVKGAAGPAEKGAELRLYLAQRGDEDLAALIALFRGAEAVYLYGASSDRNRNLMAPYLLQWQAMRDAKAAGCAVYDLFGIPPNSDPAHPMAGLYRFKTGFGGRIIHRPGSWDYPYKRLACALFRTAEGFRKRHRDKRKKKNRGEQHES
jgi:lipid II:glycine glycyltransferase (peptidoglycan interpeptide bridge formation enzyme)